MTTETRMERHVLKKTHPFHKMLADFCHLSKNLYNHANHLVRQQFFKDGSVLSYGTLDRMLKSDTTYPDYRDMPTAQSAQQTLRSLSSNWKAFMASDRDYRKHKEKYKSRPRLPGYLPKAGQHILLITNQNCHVRNGVIQFPKSFRGFTLKASFLDRHPDAVLQQVRFVPHGTSISAEIVYHTEMPDEMPYNGRCIGIDIGVNNLAAVADNWSGTPFLINGRPLKSMNQYSNKMLAKMKSDLDRSNSRYASKRMVRHLEKRKRKMDDYMHKASRYIINYCVRNNVSKVVIGHNDGWKQRTPFTKRNNQNFIQLPFNRFLEMICYKAKEHGILVVTTEEAYTSGTSFIDGEEPVKANYDKKRRVKRGLFLSDKGIPINADINGAFQIMRKAVPVKWDRGQVLCPVLVTMSQ